MLRLENILSFIFRFLFLTSLALSYSSVQSQTYQIDHYSVKEGLIGSDVNAVIQDHQGYVWLATNTGISKFDGKTFLNYSIKEGLRVPSVNALCEDRSNNIWLGSKNMSNALTRFSGIKFESIHLNKEFRTEKVVVDHLGNIWFCTIGLGAILISDSGTREISRVKYQCFDADAGLSDEVYWMHEAGNGKLWFATKNGIKTYDQKNKKIEPFHPDDFPNYEYTSITDDGKNNFFFGSSNHGLIIRNIKTQRQEEISVLNGLANNFVTGLMPDHLNNVWVSTWGGGVSIYDGKIISSINSKHGLANDKVNCLFEDYENNIWIGLRESGVDYYKGDKLISFDKKNGLENESVFAIAKDKNENLWLGTDEGISILSFDYEKKVKSVSGLSLADKIRCNRVFCLASSPDSKMIAGTFGGGVVIINPENHVIEKTLPITAKYINCLFTASDGILWIGAVEGITKYNFKTNEAESIDDFIDKDISVIYEDSRHRIWVGIRDNGLRLIRGSAIKEYLYNDTMRLSTPTSISEDYLKNIWVATNGSGLFCIKNDKICQVDDLNSNFCSAVISADSSIFIGTNFGLSEIKYSDNGKFEINDIGATLGGFGNNEIRSNSFYYSKKWKLWFGSGHGAIRYDISKKNKADRVPETLLKTNLKVSSKDYSLLLDSVFSSFDNDFTFEFAGMYFTNPKSLQFRYQLIGFDSSFTTTDQPNARLRNLAPGKYTFKVQAFVDSKKPSIFATYSFVITPPFWTRWWFRLFTAMALTTIIYVAYRRRIKIITGREKEKTAINKSIAEMEMKALRSQMNPHFMFNSLQSIQTFLLQKNTEEANKYLIKFSKLMRIVLENSQYQDVPLKEDLKALELYMQLEALRLKYSFTYEIKLDESVDQESATIPPLILQPFVENAIWHGLQYKEETGHINIFIRKVNNTLVCTVEDNGIGRDLNKKVGQPMLLKKESLGMKLTEERLKILSELKKMKACFNITDLFNSENKSTGTRIEVSLPSDV